MAEFEFVDELPPKVRRTRGQQSDRDLIAEFAAALRARPGVWAKWPADISVASSPTYRKRIQEGVFPAFRNGVFAAAERNGLLYVRYVGGEDTDGEQ